jgi:hypothetical protein
MFKVRRLSFTIVNPGRNCCGKGRVQGDLPGRLQGEIRGPLLLPAGLHLRLPHRDHRILRQVREPLGSRTGLGFIIFQEKILHSV